MKIIDSHVHTGINWGEPVEVLLFQMDANRVDHAVLVGHNGNYDNIYIFDCARLYPGRFKVVALIDPDETNKVKALEDLHKRGAAGIRINLRKPKEWNPDEPAFKAAGELGIVVSVIGNSEDFASAKFKKLLDNCPKTHFCLEHLVRAARPQADTEPPCATYKAALECARWPNTTVKVPGRGEIMPKPHRLPTDHPYDQDSPLYAMAKEAFGVQRMMWGSNFPPSAGKEGYRNTLQGVLTLPVFQKGDDLEWVMGKTAAKFWGFSS